MKARLVKTEVTAKGINTFWFQPERSVHFIAGQFVQVRIPHDKPDKRGDKRWYTLSSSPTESLLAITTKFSTPQSSFKQALLALTTSESIEISDPMGDFVLPKDSTIPLIFVAGGIGITPMRSMVKFLYDTSEKRQITILYAAKTANQLAFLPLFSKYDLKLITQIAVPLTASGIIDHTKPGPHSRLYISGPEPVVEDIVKQFKTTTVTENQIITDYFPGYSEI